MVVVIVVAVVVVELVRVEVVVVVVGNLGVVVVVELLVVVGEVVVIIVVILVFVVILVVVAVVIGAFVVSIVVVVLVMVVGVVIVVVVVVVVIATTPLSHPGGRTSSVIGMLAVVEVRVIMTFWYWVITLVIWEIIVTNNCMLVLICSTSEVVHVATVCFTMVVVCFTISTEFPMRMLEVYSVSTVVTSVM